MQVISSRRIVSANGGGRSIARTLAVGIVLLGAGALVAYAVFAGHVLSGLTPSGPRASTELFGGVLIWTFGLTAPAAFGMVGIARVGSAIEHLADRRARPTPALRAQATMPADHPVAVNVHLPGGAWVVPEIVIGPFGAAVIEELPAANMIVSRRPHSWDVRTKGGHVETIDHPLERAARDADRVRAWLAGEDAEHIVKVHAAVVSTDVTIGRTAGCAVILEDQLGAWLASLPAQRSFDHDRRERVISLLRAAT